MLGHLDPTWGNSERLLVTPETEAESVGGLSLCSLISPCPLLLSSPPRALHSKHLAHLTPSENLLPREPKLQLFLFLS